MPEKPPSRSAKVYVVQGRGERDDAGCHAAYYSSPAVAQVPRRRGEEIARILTRERPLHGVNPEVYAPGHPRRAR